MCDRRVENSQLDGCPFEYTNPSSTLVHTAVVVRASGVPPLIEWMSVRVGARPPAAVEWRAAGTPAGAARQPAQPASRLLAADSRKPPALGLGVPVED